MKDYYEIMANRVTIEDYGFNENLNMPIDRIKTAAVYDSIEERLSKLLQPGESVAGVIPGLKEVERG